MDGLDLSKNTTTTRAPSGANKNTTTTRAPSGANNSGTVESLSRLGNPMGCCREINID